MSEPVSVAEWAEWAEVSLELAEEQFAAGAEAWSFTLTNIKC